MKRMLLVAAAALVAATARADQLIQIPTADRVSAPTVEYKQRVSGHDEGYATLLFPAGGAYEVLLRHYADFDHQHRLEGGGQLQILPDGVLTPGIALGVWDLTNSSPWGRRAFLVLTKGLRPGQLGLPRYFERVQFTLGTGTGRFSGILAGLRLDLEGRASLIAEFDARRFNAGFWYTPIKPLTLKAELQNGNPFLGAELRTGF